MPLHDVTTAKAGEGILDWHHARERVWDCQKLLRSDPAKPQTWAASAMSHLWKKGGTGLA